MLTDRNFGTFEREHAEVPHGSVANARTGSEDEEHGSSNFAQSVVQADEPNESMNGLLQRAKAGDGTALNELLASVRPRAMAAALRVLHNPDDAEDAVQEAFLKIWRSLPTFEGRSSFSTWVHRIVTNASLDVMRKSAARAETVERVDRQDDVAVTAVEPTNHETPESELASREIGKLVRLAVAALPAAHRQAVVLREFEDYSYQEMAEIIECPIGTVMSRLHHARNRLASDLRAPLGESLAA
jgi:RNA polymerase sigma-70 factor (ECF subfamily)